MPRPVRWRSNRRVGRRALGLTDAELVAAPSGQGFAVLLPDVTRREQKDAPRAAAALPPSLTPAATAPRDSAKPDFSGTPPPARG
jgi:hypothetical protein